MRIEAEPIRLDIPRHWEYVDRAMCEGGGPRFSRRQILKGMGMACIGAALGLPQSAWALPTELLHEVVRLTTPGATLSDKAYMLDTDFATGSPTRNCAVLGEGTGVAIDNVHIDTGFRTWQSRWNVLDSNPGVTADMCGFEMGLNEPCLDFTVTNCSARGFPRDGLNGTGWDGYTISGFRAVNCFHPLFQQPRRRSRNGLIENVYTCDTWGPETGFWVGVDTDPSKMRPGEFIGAGGIAISYAENLTMQNCVAVGEQTAGIRITYMNNTTLVNCYSNGALFQGVGSAGSNETPSQNIRVVGCTFDKTLTYATPGSFSYNINCVSVSWAVRDIEFESCTIRNDDMDGHGAQIAGNPSCSVSFRGCLFSGFNGMRGTQEAHALHRNPDCSVNADFLTVNRFENQDNLVLVE